MAVISLPQTGSDTLPERVAAEVRALMGRHKVTQAQLAEVLGLSSQGAVSYRLNGTQEFKLSELDALAEYFGTTVEELVGGTRVGPRPGGGPDGGVRGSQEGRRVSASLSTARYLDAA